MCIRDRASVVMVNPGGTGRPIRVISARFAPLPPSRSLRSLLPSAKSYTSLGTADLRRDDTDRYLERSDQFNLNDFGGIPPGQGPWSRLRWLARLVVSAIGFRSKLGRLSEADWSAGRVVDGTREPALDCHHSRDGVHALQQLLDHVFVGELTTQSHEALVDKHLDV